MLRNQDSRLEETDNPLKPAISEKELAAALTKLREDHGQSWVSSWDQDTKRRQDSLSLGLSLPLS